MKKKSGILCVYKRKERKKTVALWMDSTQTHIHSDSPIQCTMLLNANGEWMVYSCYRNRLLKWTWKKNKQFANFHMKFDNMAHVKFNIHVCT